MRILIVEDSETLSEALNRSLKTEGYACDIAADGQAALQFLKSYRYDAIMLDLMLPRLDGFGVLQALGGDAGAAPVLVLSAREQLDDRVRALDAGADDIETSDEGFEISTEPADFGGVCDALKDAGYELASAEIAMVPSTEVELEDPGDIKKMLKMIDMFDDNEDVQAVWHNWPGEDDE